jgi:hypothetical protein
MKLLLLRILYVIVLCLCITLVPWWITAILAIGAGFIFPLFWEMILIGGIYDLVFHIPYNVWYGSITHTLIFLGLFIIISIIKITFQKPVSLL